MFGVRQSGSTRMRSWPSAARQVGDQSEGAYLNKLGGAHPFYCSHELAQNHRNHSESETEICDTVVASSPDWFCPTRNNLRVHSPHVLDRLLLRAACCTSLHSSQSAHFGHRCARLQKRALAAA